MRRLILILLFLFMGVGVLNASERSTILIVKASTCSSAGSYALYNDQARRKLAQVYKVCAEGDIDTRTYYWDGDATNLKAVIRWPEIEFVVFVGGFSWNTGGYIYPNTGDDLGYFWGHDTSYCNKDAWVWFEDGRPHVANDHYVSGAAEVTTKAVPKNGHFYTANYNGALDTLALRVNKSAVRGNIVQVNASIADVDTILTFTGYDLADGDHWMGVWSRTENGVIRYYSALSDGGVGEVLEAKICKHVTHFRKLQWGLDIDDFGMGMHVSTMSTFPNATIYLTHDNFFAHIDTLFQSIIQYDMKLSIGITTKYLRSSTAYADSNQWAEWYALAQKYKDDPHFQWVWHNHGYENPADSISATFYNQASFNDSPFSSDSLPTVAYIDSIYQSDCDSIKAWGLAVAPYLIPPTDKLDGEYGTMKDTISEFLKLNNLSSADKCPTDGYDAVYNDFTKLDKDSRIYLRYYISVDDTSDIAISEEAEEMWIRFWGTNFMNAGTKFNGFNPGVNSVGTWYSSTRTLISNLYSDPTPKIGVMHVWSCYSGIGLNHNEQAITKIGETIEYLEWLAGKDLYECRFAQDIDWEQVK